MDFNLMVMICNTTGSYGQPVIEVAYGQMIFHFTKIVWEMVAWEEWLGCWHDALPMFDIPESTPVWAPYILFYDFLDLRTYIYYILKSICRIKEHWRCLTLSWPDKVQRMFSTAYEFSNENLNHRRFYNLCYRWVFE